MASERVGHITVYSADEVAGFTYTDGDRAFLDFPGAHRYELGSESTDWFPMPTEEVVAAIGQIEFPVRGLDIDVVILHVPRVNPVESSAEGSVVFLTPGRVNYPTEHVHYTVVHEIGHVVHGALMPDFERGLWLEYACLRGFDPDAGPAAPHAWRPHEIFAEDFRALFGGRLARFGGRIENHDLLPPEEVEGLRDFFLSLAGREVAAAAVSLLPNPSAGPTVVRAPAGGSGGGLRDVRVFDMRGRLVRVLGGGGGATRVAWDGRDMNGAAVAPGAYLITGRVGDARFTRKAVRVLR
jgi:hypothetical protein